MKLRELLANVDGVEYHQTENMEIKGITTNSHACSEGYLFIGMPGTRVDGGEFWQSALAAGAVAAIVSPQAIAKYPPTESEIVISADNINKVCAQISAAFYHYPGHNLKMIGVTGTNGKTTITHLIEYFLMQAGLGTALLGTLYTRWLGFSQAAAFTTPFAVELQARLAQALNDGCEFGVMEVSSHALAQDRVFGCLFEVAVFSNLTQDHLDYHKDMEDYFGLKLCYLVLIISKDGLLLIAMMNIVNV